MSEFISFTPGVEVRGEVMAAFIGAFPENVLTTGTRILEKHGITAPKDGEFYPLQSFLDAMKEISDVFTSQMLGRIGEKIALHAVLPPGIQELLQCLSAVDIAYHMNHRGGDIGSYQFSVLGKQDGLERAVMVCPNPYPCSFDRGVIEGFAKRFKTQDTYEVVVRHDDSQPCRRKGDKSCTYIISWM